MFEFEFENGIAVGNKNVTIVLLKGEPSPQARRGIDEQGFAPAPCATVLAAASNIAYEALFAENRSLWTGR